MCVALGMSATAQSWFYDSGSNEFGEPTPHAWSVGDASGVFDNPMVIVKKTDKGASVILGNIGYTGCDVNSFVVSFDGGDAVYEIDQVSSSTSSNAYILNGNLGFGLKSRVRVNGKKVSSTMLINEMRNRETMSIKIVSHCDVDIVRFSLSGANEAITDVVTEEEINELTNKETKRWFKFWRNMGVIYGVEAVVLTLLLI